MTKILIADDHPVVRKGIKQIITDISNDFDIDEAGDGQEVLLKIQEVDYEIIFLDISMPKGGGLDALNQIKKTNPNIKVLMLSIYDDEQYIIRSLKAGASGYLTKSSAPQELEEAITKIMSGGKYISPSLTEKLVGLIGSDSELQRHESLSDREFQVLCLIAKGNSITDIAEDLFLSPKTVSTYRSRILEKMGMKNNSELIKYAITNNLVE